MGKSKFGIQFDGFTELMERLDKLNGDLRNVTEECLIAAHDIVTPKLKADISRHHRTGHTEQQIKSDKKVKWDGMTASIDVGFKLPEGLASIFLMYGTPRMKKDTKLYNDIYGNAVKKEIAAKQEEILKSEIAKRLGG